MIEFRPSFYPDEGGGGDGEPDEDSTEKVTGDLERIDNELSEAGHNPGPIDLTSISDSEIRQRLRAEVEKRRKNSLESSEEQRREIRSFLTTLRVEGADSASDQELELIWANVLKNPSLVKDFVFLLTTKNTKNNYCEFPILPDIKDLLEWSDDLGNPATLRPRIIRDGADNLEALGFSGDRVLEIEMGSHGPEQAEQMQMLGWLAGFLFMREVRTEAIKHHQLINQGPVTVESLGHTFIAMVDQALGTVKEREKNYRTNFKMDRDALNFPHSDVRRALEGTSALLDKMFGLKSES
jgi:hypothetical protein